MLNDFQKENTELKVEVSELKKQSNLVNMEIRGLKQKYNHLQKKYKEKEMECEEKSERISMLEAGMKEQDSYIKKTLKKNKVEIGDLTKQLSEKDGIISELVKTNQILHDETSALKAKIDNKEKDLSDMMLENKKLEEEIKEKECEILECKIDNFKLTERVSWRIKERKRYIEKSKRKSYETDKVIQEMEQAISIKHIKTTELESEYSKVVSQLNEANDKIQAMMDENSKLLSVENNLGKEIEKMNLAKKETQNIFRKSLDQLKSFEKYTEVKASKVMHLRRKVSAIKVLDFLTNMKETFDKALNN